MKVENIVFDMGQVLIYWQPDVLLAGFGLTPEDQKLLTQELFQSVEWVQLDHGMISFEDASRKICSRLPERLRDCANTIVTNWWNVLLTPRPGMADIVRELKAKGYGLYLLSNAGTTLREYFPRIPGSECFDGLMVSAEEKLIKPQQEIYQRLYERFGLNPETCFFIDDNPANVEGALCTGMRGTVFRGDNDRLLRELKEHGIL